MLSSCSSIWVEFSQCALWNETCSIFLTLNSSAPSLVFSFLFCFPKARCCSQTVEAHAHPHTCTEDSWRSRFSFFFFFLFLFEPRDAAAVEQTLVKRGLLWRARGRAGQQRSLGFCFLCGSNDLQAGVSQANAPGQSCRRFPKPLRWAPTCDFYVASFVISNINLDGKQFAFCIPDCVSRGRHPTPRPAAAGWEACARELHPSLSSMRHLLLVCRFLLSRLWPAVSHTDSSVLCHSLASSALVQGLSWAFGLLRPKKVGLGRISAVRSW